MALSNSLRFAMEPGVPRNTASTVLLWEVTTYLVLPADCERMTDNPDVTRLGKGCRRTGRNNAPAVYRCLIRDRPKQRMRVTAPIRISITRWYRSLLAVRGPAPTANAAIPNNTPPKAIKLVISARRQRVLELRRSAIAPHNKQSPQTASTIAAG